MRAQYAAFEPDIRSGASEVYLHEMPGGQYTNLKEQAASLGIGHRWHEVAKAYADVNMAFGDIVKVTPSSKVVGDMALMMVTSDITIEEVIDPGADIAFPESVVSLFAGDLGQPPGGFPAALQQKVLAGREAVTVRPGSLLDAVDLDAEKQALSDKYGAEISDNELASYLMYPKVYDEFRGHRAEFGDVGVLPTYNYFYGMRPQEEVTTIMEDGRQLVIRYLTVTDVDERGYRRLFFEINGQPRSVQIQDNSEQGTVRTHEQADAGNSNHIGAPMPGVVVTIAVEAGQSVARGDVLLTMEAMKMETSVKAENDGTVKRVVATIGGQFEAKDLLVELE